MKYPIAKIIPFNLKKHGVLRVDDYYWLNKREDKEVMKYLNEENKFAEKYFRKNKNTYDTLFNELKKRIVKDEVSLPFFKNGYHYFQKVEGEKEYSLYYRTKNFKSKNPQLLLDINLLAKGKKFCEETELNVSPNNQLLAYSIDFVGRRKYTVYFKDLLKEKVINDSIPNTDGSIEWANDNKTVFYVLEDEITLRSYKVMMHCIGDDYRNDKCVFEEKDETFYVSIEKSRSENFIFIFSGSTTTTEYRIIDANNPLQIPFVFAKRQKNHEYYIDEAEGVFYIKTNFNAKNFKIAFTILSKKEVKYWKDFIPYNSKYLTESFELFKNYIVIENRIDGLRQLVIYNKKTKKNKILKFEEQDYFAGINVNEDYFSDSLRFHYGSMKTPLCIYDLNLITNKKVLRQQKKININYQASKYETKRLMIKVRDGVKVPVSLIYNKKLYKQGTNPILIYGYGSYGVIIDPYFSADRLSLLDRGFVFAIAHVRGGEDLGRSWYEDGKLLHKKNTFYDFIDVTKFLVNQKYCSSSKVFAQGGSAGGLLMGAIANMAPNLYKGIIADVPFVDVVTTMCDKNIPLTTGEYDEWGNPDSLKYFNYMLSYSPYDNVQEKNYPAMLITTGLHDSQVQYWEPAKWVAKLRVNNKSNNTILLLTNMNAGHGGVSGRYKAIEETAKSYTFILKNL